MLDDFLIIAPDEQLCPAQLDLFIDLCSYVGIPIAPEKTCGPFTTLSFAGIERDSVFQEACLPPEKICKCSFSLFGSEKSHSAGVTISDRPFKFCVFRCCTGPSLFAQTY